MLCRTSQDFGMDNVKQVHAKIQEEIAHSQSKTTRILEEHEKVKCARAGHETTPTPATGHPAPVPQPPVRRGGQAEEGPVQEGRGHAGHAANHNCFTVGIKFNSAAVQLTKEWVEKSGQLVQELEKYRDEALRLDRLNEQVSGKKDLFHPRLNPKPLSKSHP